MVMLFFLSPMMQDELEEQCYLPKQSFRTNLVFSSHFEEDGEYASR